MTTTEWEKIPDKSEEYWLEVKDPDGWYSAIVKWDGCIHYTRYSNEPMSEDADNQDYLHICNIQSEIDRLYALLQIAREHYKEHHYYKESFEKEPETIAKAETDAKREEQERILACGHAPSRAHPLYVEK